MAEPVSKTFELRYGVLVRTVVPARGKPYVHRCDLESFTGIAYWIDAVRDGGFTSNDLWEGLPDVASTRASVALDFLKERGVVRIEGRRCFAASTVTFEDAMCEWHALGLLADG